MTTKLPDNFCLFCDMGVPASVRDNAHVHTLTVHDHQADTVHDHDVPCRKHK
jgi:hypothetical protein